MCGVDVDIQVAGWVAVNLVGSLVCPRDSPVLCGGLGSREGILCKGGVEC